MEQCIGRRAVIAGITGVMVTGRSAAPGAAQDKPVELFPGYPGYRGYVGGVDGVGDHARLDDLVALDAGFDRTAEDRANLDAGRRLGLAGGPHLWTFENWMAVEAERGFAPVCYWCAILRADERTPPVGVAPDPNDPRLAIGTPRTSWWRGALASERGLPASAVTGAFATDQHLRAYILLAHPGQHLNAAEVQAGAATTVDALNSVGGASPDARWLLTNALDQGGYAPTPASAAPDDQAFMLWSAFASVAVSMPGPVHSALLSQLQFAIDGWIADTAAGEAASLVAWIRDHDALPVVTG